MRNDCKTRAYPIDMCLYIFHTQPSLRNCPQVMPQDFTGEWSILVQATSHYLKLCWPSSMMPYGMTTPQWVDINGYVHIQLRWVFIINSEHYLFKWYPLVLSGCHSLVSGTPSDPIFLMSPSYCVTSSFNSRGYQTTTKIITLKLKFTHNVW